MIVTLDSTYQIANGVDRLARVLAEDSFAVRQETQQTTRSRAEWITGFHSRAARSVPLRYIVTFPPCASLEAAYAQARNIPLTCPKGGVLTEEIGSTLTTFEDAWIEGEIGVDRIGVTNVFTFNLTAINPATTASILSQYNMNYVANLFAITGLTGGGSTKLDGYTTTDITVGFTAFLPALLIGGVAVPKMMQLVTGTDAENADPTAGLLIIRPDDFHASSNPKVWQEKL